MKSKNIFVALNGIDPHLIEKAAPLIGAKKARILKATWGRWATLAACFCLIIAISVVSFLNTVILSDGSIPLRGVNPSYGTLQFYGDESSIGSSISGTSYMPMGISVTAELVEMLPDTYTFYDDWEQREYGLLKLRTVKLLKGAEMAEEFYYLVPAGYMADYTIYDKFVITDMAQCGYEYFAMYNKSTGEAERFDEVLFGYNDNSYHSYLFMGTNFKAFNEQGYFDTRLWSSTDAWKKSTANRTPPNTLNMAEKMAAVPIYNPESYVHSIKDIGESATNGSENILNKYLSFENGVYVPSFYSYILATDSNSSFSARRYINGFATNEKVSIGASKYSHSKAQFDENDLAALPDLASAMAAVARAFDKGKIAPPHIEDYKNYSIESYGIFGWYAKTESGVIGIIRVNWKFNMRGHGLDDAYYIIEYGEDKCKPVTRDALLEIIGEYEKTYIYTGKYDSNGKYFQMFGI